MGNAKNTQFGFQAGITKQTWSFVDLALKTRFAQALEEGSTCYPIHRSL